jgi:hypothetical protein
LIQFFFHNLLSKEKKLKIMIQWSYLRYILILSINDVFIENSIDTELQKDCVDWHLCCA